MGHAAVVLGGGSGRRPGFATKARGGGGLGGGHGGGMWRCGGGDGSGAAVGLLP